MSFIVDAARRRELDEEPSEAAAWAYSQMQKRQRRLWIAFGTLTLVAIVLICVLLVSWLLDSRESELAPTEAKVLQEPGVASDLPPTDAVSEVSSSVEDVPFYLPIERPSVEEKVYQAPIALSDAPEGIQAELLQFRYSSHLYSNQPEGRSLSVNGQRLREGDSLDNWSLDEITEEGAVWNNGDIHVSVNVLELWR